jgi:hypothetical protein
MRNGRTLGALAIFGLAAIAGCDSIFDEPMYRASVTLEKEWDVGSSPQLVVDLFGGPIFVHPGPLGKVGASLSIGRVSKVSQDVADRAVRTAPGVSMTQEGDSIRITELNGNAAMCSLHLSVPAGIRLDLHAGAGDIYVGPSPRESALTTVTVAGLKARQDSVGVLTVNVSGAWSHSPALDLEGDKLILTVNGKAVDVGSPTKNNVPGGVGRWHYVSK